jgi:hypothetical protein
MASFGTEHVRPMDIHEQEGGHFSVDGHEDQFRLRRRSMLRLSMPMRLLECVDVAHQAQHGVAFLFFQSSLRRK